MRRRFLIFILCIAALLSACRESPQTMMKKQLDLGQKYLVDKNYEEALLSFQLTSSRESHYLLSTNIYDAS